MSELYRLANDALAVKTAGETVIMAYASGKYFGVRGAVSQLLDKLRQDMSLEEMVAELTAHFNVTADAAREDLKEVLPKLTAAGILIQTSTEQ